MFPGRYFNERYYAIRYWPKVGSGTPPSEEAGGGWVEEMDVFCPGAVDMQAYVCFPVNMGAYSAWPEEMETQ